MLVIYQFYILYLIKNIILRNTQINYNKHNSNYIWVNSFLENILL